MSFITNDMSLILSRLEAGDVVAIPTETVYGLAADYANEKAIEKIFAMKKRPSQHPLIMHILPEWDILQWVKDVPDVAWDAMNLYWPGPLTLVFPLKAQTVSTLITGGQSTVAIRAPSHPLMLELLKRLGRPIVAPSANPFEKLSPTTAVHVQKHFLHEDLAILEGGRCEVGIESTIVDMAHDVGTVLRAGQCDFSFETIKKHTDIRVPGAHSKHYQPYKPCYYLENLDLITEELDDFYVMRFDPAPHQKTDYLFPLDFKAVCYEFYYQLQKADESDAKAILIELPKHVDFQMIIDKIKRAATLFGESN